MTDSPPRPLAPQPLKPVPATILAVLVILMALYAAGVSAGVIHRQSIGLDFMPLWTAGRMPLDEVYDFVAITRAQATRTEGLGLGLRPFVYPPSALFLLAPFAALPFRVATLAWVVLGAGLISVATAIATPQRRWLALILLLASPPFAMAVVTGQTTLLVAGLGVIALWQLDRRPWLAGLLIGLAATLKPTLVAAAPILFLVDRRWRALAFTIAAGALVGLAGVAVFGVSAWTDWLAALGRFQAEVLANPGLVRNMISPTAAAHALGASPPVLTAVHWLGALAGLAVAAFIFRRADAWPARSLALFGGSLTLSAYAMGYDVASLGPAVAALAAAGLGTRRWWAVVIPFALYAVADESYVAPYGLVALLVFAALSQRKSANPLIAQPT